MSNVCLAALYDTNIFLEFLLNQEKAEDCEALFEAIAYGQCTAILTQYSLHALETILNRRKFDKELIQFLSSLQRLTGTQIYTTTIEEELIIARLTLDLPLDFDDALQYYVAKKLGISLVTLDCDFKKICDIEIYSPAAWLKRIMPAI